MRVARREFLSLAFGASTFAAGFGAARAQTYPARTVKVVVGYSAGGGPDIQARALSQQLGKDLGQPFFVENHPGANGTIAARLVAQSGEDGYTLLYTSSSIIPTPYIYKSLGYDTLTDLRPIATAGILDGLLMLVDATSPIHSVPEFIAAAKKDHLAYGSPGVGNILHLAAEIFCQKTGVTMQHVPYKGASEVSAALLGGNIQVMFVTPPSVMGLLRDGRLRPIAYTGTKPFPTFPDVPLMQSFVPDFAPIGSWGMFLASGKMPTAIVDTLNGAVRKALLAPEVAAVMQRDGFFPDERNAEQTATFFREQVAWAGAAVKAAGIEAN
jgi:tripartite-type tricarboxylate transporter receptor subunit TctC